MIRHRVGYWTQTTGRIIYATDSTSAVTCVISGATAIVTQPVGFGNDGPEGAGTFAGYFGYVELTGLTPNLTTHTFTLSQNGEDRLGKGITAPANDDQDFRLIQSTCEFFSRGLMADPYTNVRAEVDKAGPPVAAYCPIDDIAYIDTTRVNGGGVFISTGNPHQTKLEWDYGLAWMSFYGIYGITEPTGTRRFNPAQNEDRMWVMENLNQWAQWGDHESAPDFGRSVSDPAVDSSGRDATVFAVSKAAFDVAIGNGMEGAFLGVSGTYWGFEFGMLGIASPDSNTFSQPYNASDVGDSSDFGRPNTDSGGTRTGHATNPQRISTTVGAYNAGTTYSRTDYISNGGFNYVSKTNNNTGNTPPAGAGSENTAWIQQDTQGKLDTQFPSMTLPVDYLGETQIEDILSHYETLGKPFNILFTSNGIAKRNEPWADRWPEEWDRFVYGDNTGPKTEGFLRLNTLNGNSGKFVFAKGDTHGREVNQYIPNGTSNVLGGATHGEIWEINPGTINGSTNAANLGALGIDYQNGTRIYELDGNSFGEGGSNGSVVFGSFSVYTALGSIADKELQVKMVDSSDASVVYSASQYQSIQGNKFYEERPMPITGLQLESEGGNNVEVNLNASDRWYLCGNANNDSGGEFNQNWPEITTAINISQVSFFVRLGGAPSDEDYNYDIVILKEDTGFSPPRYEPYQVGGSPSYADKLLGSGILNVLLNTFSTLSFAHDIDVPLGTLASDERIGIVLKQQNPFLQLMLIGNSGEAWTTTPSRISQSDDSGATWANTGTNIINGWADFVEVASAGSPTLETTYDVIVLDRGTSGSINLGTNWSGASTFSIKQLPFWMTQSGDTGTVDFTNVQWGGKNSDNTIGGGVWNIEVQAIDSTGLLTTETSIWLYVRP